MERIEPVYVRTRAAQANGPTDAMPTSPARDVVGWERTIPLVQISPQLAHRFHLRPGSSPDRAADAFRLVRTRLLHNLEERGWRSIAVVGCLPGDGRTLVAVNLALSLSQDTRGTVLLVDLDLRHPSVHERLGLPVRAGIGEYLAGRARLDEVLVCVDNPRCAVLPCFAPIAGASELLRGRTVETLARELATRYDDRIVLYDLPPLLAGDEVISFLPNVDAVLLIVTEGQTCKQHLLRARQLLGDRPIAGIVLNRAADGDLVVY